MPPSTLRSDSSDSDDEPIVHPPSRLQDTAFAILDESFAALIKALDPALEASTNDPQEYATRTKIDKAVTLVRNVGAVLIGGRDDFENALQGDWEGNVEAAMDLLDETLEDPGEICDEHVARLAQLIATKVWQTAKSRKLSLRLPPWQSLELRRIAELAPFFDALKPDMDIKGDSDDEDADGDTRVGNDTETITGATQTEGDTATVTGNTLADDDRATISGFQSESRIPCKGTFNDIMARKVFDYLCATVDDAIMSTAVSRGLSVEGRNATGVWGDLRPKLTPSGGGRELGQSLDVQLYALEQAEILPADVRDTVELLRWMETAGVSLSSSGGA